LKSYIEEMEVTHQLEVLSDRARALPEELSVLGVAVQAQDLELPFV
tara:strand:+ start:1533 stop:1670 length:138 start_codon:yes stop_codon:yes gene_type:complete